MMRLRSHGVGVLLHAPSARVRVSITLNRWNDSVVLPDRTQLGTFGGSPEPPWPQITSAPVWLLVQVLILKAAPGYFSRVAVR